jgi:hypothetical protein
MTTTMDLAADLGVDEGDVDVLLNQLDESKQELLDDLAVLDPHGERTGRQGCTGRALSRRRRGRTGLAALIRPPEGGCPRQ